MFLGVPRQKEAPWVQDLLPFIARGGNETQRSRPKVGARYVPATGLLVQTQFRFLVFSEKELIE